MIVSNVAKRNLEKHVQKRKVDLKISDERLQQEIEEKRHALEQLKRNHLLLNAINDAQSHFITDSEKWILFDGLLKNLLSLTNSEYGFIGEILYNPAGDPYLKTTAVTNIAWNDETREFFKDNAPSGMEFYNAKMLFGPIMITGKPVISNNPSKDERKGGLPPGHPPLNCFLGVPFYQGKKLVGMAGVANCPGGYTEDIVEYLHPLLTTCANIIEAYRNENQRKRVEEELQEAKHRYQRIVEDLPYLICRYRPDTTITFVNEAYAMYFGKTTDELIGTSFLDLIPPEDHEYVVKKIESLNENSRFISLEHEVFTPQGERRWQLWRDRALFDGSGNITEIQSIGQDITEPKLAKEELVHRARLAELGNEIGIALSHGDSTQNILQRCTESIVKNLDAAFARIWTFNQRDEVLELQASAGIYTNINGDHSRIPLGMYKIGRIAKDCKSHLTNRVIGDPEVHDQEWAKREKMVSFAGYPLIVDDKLVGVMAMFSRQTLTDFSLKALSSVADNIAIGIERKQANEKMKLSEEKYRDLFLNANDAICILDSDLNYKDVNKKTVEMLGYTREELLNMSIFDLIPSEQRLRSENEFNKLREKGSYEKFDGKARTKDGRFIFVEVSSSVIKEGGKVIGSRDIIRDITERVKIEDALRENEERYRTIIEYSNDMIWTLDSEGLFLFFNKRSEEITGFRLEDWRGKSFAPLIHEKDLPNVIKIFNETMGGRPRQYEVSVKKKDGNTLILSVNTAPIYSKGEVVGTVSFGRDITDRKRGEEMMRESETRLQNILDNSSTVVFLKDIQGHYITINRRFEELFHVNRNEVIKKTDYDIFPREYADKFRQHDEQALEKRCAIEIEEVVPHEDGLHTYISVKFPLYSPDGKPYAVCGIATDITERKKAQEQIEKSLKEKEVLLREVYHRVKNNMQIITSLLKLQSRYFKDEEYRKMFRESIDRIKSMSLVHERLYKSKDLSTIDFKEYIRDIAKGLLQSYGDGKGKISLIMNINSISLDINSAIPCGLIINELVTNSIKHAFPDGKEGEIKIAIYSMDENMIELVVGDNGVGICEDVDFKKTKSLGLQLVTMLAEDQLHGEINLNRSKGTEFSITFKGVR